MDAEIKAKARELAALVATKFPGYLSFSVSGGAQQISVSISSPDGEGGSVATSWGGAITAL